MLEIHDQGKLMLAMGKTRAAHRVRGDVGGRPANHWLLVFLLASAARTILVRRQFQLHLTRPVGLKSMQNWTAQPETLIHKPRARDLAQ